MTEYVNFPVAEKAHIHVFPNFSAALKAAVEFARKLVKEQYYKIAYESLEPSLTELWFWAKVLA